MAILSPVYGIILPFLLIFTIPIALFASLTTILAFSVLIFRVLLVYVELALAVIPYWVLGYRDISSIGKPLERTKSFNKSPPAAMRRKKRRSSSSSLSATGSITPVQGDHGMGLSQSIGATRDFEGVGGWRLNDESDEDSLWTKINSRLELPSDHIRRHHRSLTSGSTPATPRVNRSYSPEAIMNTSRARTPPSVGIMQEGYFVNLPTSPKVGKRATSTHTANSGSSGSSKGSSVLSMKHR